MKKVLATLEQQIIPQALFHIPYSLRRRAEKFYLITTESNLLKFSRCSNNNKFVSKNWKWYVYIVECLDGFYYTGMTWNMYNRMEQHKLGKGSKFTSKHGFKELKYVEEFDNITLAREREDQLKDFSRKKKEALWK